MGTGESEWHLLLPPSVTLYSFHGRHSRRSIFLMHLFPEKWCSNCLAINNRNSYYTEGSKHWNISSCTVCSVYLPSNFISNWALACEIQPPRFGLILIAACWSSCTCITRLKQVGWTTYAHVCSGTLPCCQQWLLGTPGDWFSPFWVKTSCIARRV